MRGLSNIIRRACIINKMHINRGKTCTTYGVLCMKIKPHCSSFPNRPSKFMWLHLSHQSFTYEYLESQCDHLQSHAMKGWSPCDVMAQTSPPVQSSSDILPTFVFSSVVCSAFRRSLLMSSFIQFCRRTSYRYPGCQSSCQTSEQSKG